MIVRILALLLLFLFVPVTSYADTEVDPTTTGDPTGGTCDWSAIKESLYQTESSGSGGYTAIGPETRYGRPLGKYQFIPETQENMLNAGNCDPARQCRGRNILQPACHPVQECMMDALLAHNLEAIQNNSACQTLLNENRPISGCGQGNCLNCTATESGLLAAYHLGGADECGNLLRGSGDSDNTGTSTGYYACKHGGLPVPGNCTPQDYGYSSDPFTSSPTLTYRQAEFMEESGDIHGINLGANSIKTIWVAGLQLMANQLSTTMMAQAQAIGQFFDAKHQLETQRLMQQKAAEAHKDYHPSVQMCEIGTFVRDLANSEERARLSQVALNKMLMDRAMASGESKNFAAGSDVDTRIKAYQDKFCDKTDNVNYNEKLCRQTSQQEQVNADINFTQLIDKPLTIKVDLLDEGKAPDAATALQEENLFSFLEYIFMHDPYPAVDRDKTILSTFIEPYSEMRSLVAMRSVAQNSFSEIIAQKVEGSEDSPTKTNAPFLKALMEEVGIKKTEIEDLIGERPSYYAQMEVLTKKIYQHPEFISNLYDKPANVKRMIAAMTAIKIMQDRDIHDSLMRREMLLSMILEINLRYRQQDMMNREIRKVLGRPLDLDEQD